MRNSAISRAAIVLCGGKSSRMGHPKELLPFGPETLLHRMIRLVRSVSDWVVVVAGADEAQILAELPDSVILARDPVGGRGPIQGMVAGLDALPMSVELVYITAVDLPFLKPEWIPYLADIIEGHDIAVPHVDGRYHPLSAMYRKSTVLPAAQSLLNADKFRVTTLVESLSRRVVTGDEMRTVDPELGSLRNLNTLDDYRRALIDVGIA